MNAICIGTWAISAPLFNPCAIVDPITALALYYVAAVVGACIVATALFRRFG